MTSPFSQEALLQDTQFFFPNGLSPDKLEEFHKATLDSISRLQSAEQVAVILGNYSNTQKERLNLAQRTVSESDNQEAYLLDEIDPGIDLWENFYVKFRVFLERSDYVIAVVEDNDGGHELELGEVNLNDLYVVKRDYTGPSIRDDLEYEKYDAMIGTLFDLLERRGRLFHWTSERELVDSIGEVADEVTK